RLSVRRVVRTLLPIAAVSGAMWLAVQAVSRWLGTPSWWGLLLEIGTGAAVYLLLSLACRLEAWQELLSLARQQLKKGASA
ncbi:MAG: lipopolysaccharide biosynthesis protein, partial [Alistipes sp.]|nr:lipopolysaccharide biosynthesis protein [Alistipes sp.]